MLNDCWGSYDIHIKTGVTPLSHHLARLHLGWLYRREGGWGGRASSWRAASLELTDNLWTCTSPALTDNLA